MDDVLNDMTKRLQQRLRSRQKGRQGSSAMPSEGYQWSYRWSSNSAAGHSGAQGLMVLATHQNQPETSTFPGLPLPLRNPAQQIQPLTRNPPSHNQAPTPPTSSSSPHNHSISACLTFHNGPRSAQNIPALEWSDTLHHDAQKYAERLARKGRMEHSSSLGETGQGENLYASSDRKAGFGEAVGAWMGEARYYTPGAKVGSARGGGLGRWGHYCESCTFHLFPPPLFFARFALQHMLIRVPSTVHVVSDHARRNGEGGR